MRAASGEVAGRLLGPGGTPLTGYVVQLQGGGGAVAESLPTDAEGRFRMTTVEAGVYDVEILTGDLRLCTAQIAPAVVPEAGSLEIDIRLDSTPVCDGNGPTRRSRASETGAKPRDQNRKRGYLWGSLGAGAALALLAGGGGGSEPSQSPSRP